MKMRYNEAWKVDINQRTQRERSIFELSAIRALGDDLCGTFPILSAAALFVLKDT